MRDAAQLAWIINLGCIDLNPHPIRADDLDHPDELRVDLDPVPGIGWAQIRDVALVVRESLEAAGPGRLAEDLRLAGDPRQRPDRAQLDVSRRCAGRPSPSPATSSSGHPTWRPRNGGRRSATGSSSTTTRTPRTGPSPRPTPSGRGRTPGSRRRLTWDEVRDDRAGRSRSARSPRATREIGDPGAGIDEAVGSLDGLLELSARHEDEGLGDAPWPPNYAKQAGEPPRVQPSRAAPGNPTTSRAAVRRGGPPPEGRRRASSAVAAVDANARPADGAGRTRPTPTGRRKSAIPVVEIARAEHAAEALEGLERWKVRHPEVVPFLEAPDILVD